MYTGIVTQDNTGNTGSEHRNMNRFGGGTRYARILYYKQEIVSGLDDTEFECGTRFWESRNSCGCDNGGCHDSELAGMSAAVTWVLWDVTVFPPQGPHQEVLRMT